MSARENAEARLNRNLSDPTTAIGAAEAGRRIGWALLDLADAVRENTAARREGDTALADAIRDAGRRAGNINRAVRVR